VPCPLHWPSAIGQSGASRFTKPSSETFLPDSGYRAPISRTFTRLRAGTTEAIEPLSDGGAMHSALGFRRA
jgi:hypothetical protein